jgi:aryl-alcohol dehydrogenase-like predicted oxidoreductase
MRRRDFLRAAAASGATITAKTPALWASSTKSTNAAKLPLRPFGQGGEKLSIIGFPGFALKQVEMDQVKRVVAESIERGMNYFDVAPLYGDAEERLGPALEPYRKDVFLACKTDKRDRAGAEADLKRSFERLRTKHFDLYQLHYITDVKKDVDVAFGKGGAMEVLIEAKKAGVVKHLGFSAHSVEAAVSAMERYDFDSALVPINYGCMLKGNFGPQIIALAKKKNVTLLAIKPIARQRWPKDAPQRKKYNRCWYQPITDPAEAELSLRYTLSQPVASAIPPADLSFLMPTIDMAMRYKPVTAEETSQLTKMAANLTPIFSHQA